MYPSNSKSTVKFLNVTVTVRAITICLPEDEIYFGFVRKLPSNKYWKKVEEFYLTYQIDIFIMNSILMKMNVILQFYKFHSKTKIA